MAFASLPFDRRLMRLHSAEEDLGDRTSVLARVEGSNLLEKILDALDQQVTGHPVAGAPGRPGDHLLVLVGHDKNLASIAGMLGLNWIVDGRRDDTPPGGALVFELWRSQTTATYSVRVYFTAQSLEQMRNSQVLTLDNPPNRVPIFIPGCGGADSACAWPAFTATVRQTIDPEFVKASP